MNILDKGFIKLIDVMGSDESIVNAARISYGVGTRKVSDDRGLIRYLMRNMHTSPFEMAEMIFHVKVPMDCWRQWIRHRTANVNEYSTRYSEAIDDTFVSEKWRKQSKNNKQGSSDDPVGWPIDHCVETDEMDAGKYLSNREIELHQHSRNVYDERLLFGVAKEQARKDLPLSTYTEAIWKCDLHNIFHFLALRLDKHAQLEIRLYAEGISHFVSDKFPLSWEAFVDYRLDAMRLSRIDLLHIRALLEKRVCVETLGKTERDELNVKLTKLGFESCSLES